MGGRAWVWLLMTLEGGSGCTSDNERESSGWDADPCRRLAADQLSVCMLALREKTKRRPFKHRRSVSG